MKCVMIRPHKVIAVVFAVISFALITPTPSIITSSAFAGPTGKSTGESAPGKERENEREETAGQQSVTQPGARRPAISRNNRFRVEPRGRLQDREGSVASHIMEQQARDFRQADLAEQEREVNEALETMEEFRTTQNEIREDLVFIDKLPDLGPGNEGNRNIRARLLNLQHRQIIVREKLDRQIDALLDSVARGRNERGQQGVLSLMREVSVIQSEVDRATEAQLAKVAAYLFGDTYRVQDYTARRPLGSGGNSETFIVTRRNEAGEDVEFAMKFDPTIEIAPDDNFAGIDPRNVRGAERSQASSHVARLFELDHIVTRSEPVLIDGKPAQEMQLLDGYVPPFPETFLPVEFRGKDGRAVEERFEEAQRQNLIGYRTREAGIRELESRETLNDLELGALASSRTEQARFKLEGNPVTILEREELGNDPRLAGAQSLLDFDDPVLQERLNQMQFLDLLNGQIDRNSGNILIKYEIAKDENGQDILNEAGDPVYRVVAVSGIDNNMSMGTRGATGDADPARLTMRSNDEDGEGEMITPLGTLPPLPKKVDLSVATEWLDKSEAEFLDEIGLNLETGESTRKDGLPLSAEQKTALFRRFQATRNHIIELVENGHLVTSAMDPERDAKIRIIAQALDRDPTQIDASDVWGSKPGWQNYFRSESDKGTVSAAYEAEMRYHDGSYLARIVTKHETLGLVAQQREAALARQTAEATQPDDNDLDD